MKDALAYRVEHPETWELIAELLEVAGHSKLVDRSAGRLRVRGVVVIRSERIPKRKTWIRKLLQRF
jgi:hypothetical protein